MLRVIHAGFQIGLNGFWILSDVAVDDHSGLAMWMMATCCNCLVYLNTLPVYIQNNNTE